MLPGLRRAVPAAQTLQQPGLGGSHLPSQAAGPCQRHRGGRATPGVPPGAGISPHSPRGAAPPAAPAARSGPGGKLAGARGSAPPPAPPRSAPASRLAARRAARGSDRAGAGRAGGGGARARARRGARAGPRAPRGWKRLLLATPPFAVTEVWGRCHRLLAGGGAQRGVESGSGPETRRTPMSHLPKGVSRVLFSQPEVVLRGHSKRPAGPPEVYGATGGQGSARESGEAGGHLPHLPSHSPFKVTSRGLGPSGVTKP